MIQYLLELHHTRDINSFINVLRKKKKQKSYMLKLKLSSSVRIYMVRVIETRNKERKLDKWNCNPCYIYLYTYMVLFGLVTRSSSSDVLFYTKPKPELAIYFNFQEKNRPTVRKYCLEQLHGDDRSVWVSINSGWNCQSLERRGGGGDCFGAAANWAVVILLEINESMCFFIILA